MAVVDPPLDPNVPVVSKVFIGVPPPSRTRINNVLSDAYTEVNCIVAPEAASSMYDTKQFAPFAALFVEKS